jgi:hypothetical protein
MTLDNTGLLLKSIVLGFCAAALSACSPFNQGIDQDLSNQSMVCKDGIKYLPFTNGRDQAYTSEGRPETCPRDL